MATLSDLNEAAVIAFSEALAEPDWLRDRRQAACKSLADLPWPTPKVEEWRHTDPRRIALEREIVTAPGSTPAIAEGFVAGDERAARVRIVDGGVVEAVVEGPAADRGVVAADLSSAAVEHSELVAARLGSVVGAEDAFTAVNLAAFTGAVLVHVPDGVELDAPVMISLQVTAPGAHLPRVLIDVGANAKADVYLDRGGAADATVVEVVEITAGDGAQVRLASRQDWGEGVAHVGWHRASVGRSGDVKALEATFGGDTVYIRPDVVLDGEGAHGELYGLYYGSGEQRFEHRSLIHHNASHTSSESVYKGALQDTARAVWFGNIRIEAHAKATTSDETNRNLILTDGAKADSIPFLEILTSDVVACGHHSSVGQIDELQLFYLESRGIPRAEAARLLVFGFFTEVLERIDLPGVTDAVLAEIEHELRQAPTTLMDPRRAQRQAAVGAGA